MEIQGIKILRISDLRRFFDLADFWEQREDLTRIVGDPSNTVFFDNAFETKLYCILREWIIRDFEIPSRFLGDDKILVNIDTQDTALQLGRLAPEISKFRGIIKNKDIIGLTILYIILGADKEDSDILLQYDLFTALRTGNYLGDFIRLYKNYEFETSAIPVYPLSRRIIANMNIDHPICICSGSQELELLPGDCVVGIFGNKACFRLLTNSLCDSNNGVTLKLKINTNTNRPKMELHTHDGLNIIEDVSSIAIEQGGYPVYTTFDGILHVDDHCYELNAYYQMLLRHLPNVNILAIESNMDSHYTIYTEDSIIKQ